ncbi:MAG: ATP-binding protein [Candidatus Jettenia caeni]|nr:MAG: ATP-binding protein [Candidatus Jettenia caeni]
MSLNVDFENIREIDGSKQKGFEELCCQMAYHETSIPKNSIFHRYEGAGGDGGVECIWILPNGDEWGWQAKYLFELKKDQLDKSVKTTLECHPKLKKYFICMPFNLTGPKKGRGKSQTEKFDEYKKEWKILAKSKGMDIDFIFVGKSMILGFLSTDPGCFRFWSERELFGDGWFKNQVETAAKAEPRYTPVLNIKVPVAASLEVFGHTELWKDILKEKTRIVTKDLKDWLRDIKDEKFPTECMRDGESLREILTNIINEFRKGHDSVHKSLSVDFLCKNVKDAIELISNCEEICTYDLEKKYGKGVADSVGFRQFQAEYMCDFPAQFVDSSREILLHLRELQEWILQINISLLNSQTMLLLGPAGAGKTHLICDIAISRFKRSLKSIVLLGKQFYSGEPWTQIISILGLPLNISRNDLLEMLNTAAEISRYPLVIFIDALNESKPCDIWLSYLASMTEDIKRYPWLRLCVACRSTYYDSVIPERLQIPKVIHTGFEGIEFNACFEFFKWYTLEFPSTPLMQPEFTNPLFLKLVCESLHDSGVTKLPEKEYGISKVIHDVLSAKNKKIAKMLDYNPNELLVQKAVDALVAILIQKQSMWLEWNETKNIVDQIRPSINRSASLFEELVAEGILFEEGISGSHANESKIRIGFERFSEYLIAEKYLEGLNADTISDAFENNGKLNFLITNQHAMNLHKGILEAMAIQIPEKFRIELNQVIRQHSTNPVLYRAVTESIKWRTNSSITDNTKRVISAYFSIPTEIEEAINRNDALLSVSTRVGNLLNAEWRHNAYASMSMPKRDAILQPIWHLSFGKLGVFDRLLRWALQVDVKNINTKSAELWTTQLLWFCVASDRRVRDYATKGIVRIMDKHAHLWPIIINRFAEVDDDYLLERCFATAYGSLIRTMDNETIRKTAELIIEVFFDTENLPVNVLVRDYLRGILELASEHGLLPKNRNIEEFRPPYKSEWPLDWPKKEEIEKFKDSYEELPKLYQSVFEDDFEKYIVGRRFNSYEEFNRDDALRWIFKHVLEMGYLSILHANFDRYILGKYGHGRSKPEWAERVGKKYQWIALYRLIGYISDNAKPLPSRWDSPPSTILSFLAVDKRNIDPTHFIKKLEETDTPQWWMQVNYDFNRFIDLSDEKWLDMNDDYPEGQKLLKVVQPEIRNESWIILNNYITWRNKKEEQNIEYDFDKPFREFWIHVHSFLIKKQNFRNIWQKLKTGAISIFPDYRIPEHSHIFLGEYPWAITLKNQLQLFHQESNTLEKTLISSVHSINLSYEYDSFTATESRSTLYLPSPVFFKNDVLKWNGENGYFDSTNKLVFENPFPCTIEANSCIANLEYIINFLDTNDLVLLWGIWGQKYKHNGYGKEYLGYNEGISYHYLRGEKIISDVWKNKRFRK